MPLVRTGPDAQWDDLPSEHWAELVDAWMCHGDMALNERVARHARGMWPRDGQVLVGGSYVLVGARDVVQEGLRVGEAKVCIDPNIFFPLFRLCISPGVKKAGAGYFHQRPAYRSCNRVFRDAVFANAGCAGFNWLIQTVLE